jgi:hypothetical protein
MNAEELRHELELLAVREEIRDLSFEDAANLLELEGRRILAERSSAGEIPIERVRLAAAILHGAHAIKAFTQLRPTLESVAKSLGVELLTLPVQPNKEENP